MIHVYPANDQRAHTLHGTQCPCEPRIEWQNNKTSDDQYEEAIVIHNAFDLRDALEQIQDL